MKITASHADWYILIVDSPIEKLSVSGNRAPGDPGGGWAQYFLILTWSHPTQKPTPLLPPDNIESPANFCSHTNAAWLTRIQLLAAGFQPEFNNFLIINLNLIIDHRLVSANGQAHYYDVELSIINQNYVKIYHIYDFCFSSTKIKSNYYKYRNVGDTKQCRHLTNFYLQSLMGPISLPRPNVHVRKLSKWRPVFTSVPARPISEGAAPCPYWLAPCPIYTRPARINLIFIFIFTKCNCFLCVFRQLM